MLYIALIKSIYWKYHTFSNVTYCNITKLTYCGHLIFLNTLLFQMWYIGILGHSHARKLHRYWYRTTNITPIGLPGHKHILAYMHTPPTQETHYSHITVKHPHINTILISWGDNDIDQPGETIKLGITRDIVQSLIYLILFFAQQNIPVFIIPPLPRKTPSLTTHVNYTAAAMYITHWLARYINDLRIPYSPIISLPSLAMSRDGIHPTFQAYENLRTTIIRHMQLEQQSLRQRGITQL